MDGRRGTGRCDAPLHGAPVGWGFFGSQAKSPSKTNPSSLLWTEPQYLCIVSPSAPGLQTGCSQIRPNSSAKSVLYRLLEAGNQSATCVYCSQGRRLRSPASGPLTSPPTPDSYLDGACVRLLPDFARKECALAGCSALEISRKQHLSLARSAGSARQPVGRQRPRRF
jgi:hypothetical protein